MMIILLESRLSTQFLDAFRMIFLLSKIIALLCVIYLGHSRRIGDKSESKTIVVYDLGEGTF